MSWEKQVDAAMTFWRDAQQQMIDNWMTLAQSVWQDTAPTSTRLSRMRWADMWREITDRGIRTWMETSSTTARNAAEQMFASQTAMMRLIEMTLNAWQNILPAVESGQDWQSALEAQMEKIHDQLLQTATGGAVSALNIGEQWQAYLNQWQFMVGPWTEAFQSSMKHVPMAMGGDRSALVEMTGLYWDAYQDTLGKLLRAPGLGYTREMDEKVRLAFAAWLDLQQCAFEYQVILADTWVKAFKQLLTVTANLAEDNQGVESMRAFLDQWSDVADEVFKDVFRSDEYVQVQARLINASMKFRVRQRSVNEMALTLMDLPTRTEVDEAHRRIYELRKEVKALKKELASLKADKPAPAKSSPAKRSGSSSRKSKKK